MAFYSDLAAMAADLMRPDSVGGLGQGSIQIVRIFTALPDPDHPETPVVPTETIDTVDQIGMPKAEYRAGETVITSDAAYIITPTKLFVVAPGDVVRIAGVDTGTVVHVEPLGSLDVPIYTKIWVNR